MSRRNYSDHYDPDLTREDMGRPTRQELAREAALERGGRDDTPTSGPLTDAVKAWSNPWQPGPELDARIAAATQDGRRKSPTGACHECGKRVTGERKFCGACMARRSK